MATLCEVPALAPMGPMEERDEEEDDPEAALQKSVGEWILTEEDVQREKEESLARTEAAKAHVKTQEGATLRINAKLTEHGDYDLLAVAHGVSGAQRHHSPGLQRQAGSNWPTALLEGSGSPEQRHSARVVAEEMLRRQERFYKFDRRRREVLAESEQLQSQFAKDLEAADLRCAQRQRERLQESRRRAFAAQQRRAEQQKVFKENQRDQERVWESYYTKKEREKVKERQEKAERESKKGLPAASGGPRAKSSSAQDLAGWLEEEVYKTTLQSHQSYSETIERWRQFEKENERRTEAHKKKLLLSAGYSYSRSSIDDSDLGKGDKRLRGLKESSSRKSLTARRASSTSDTSLAATAPLPGPDAFGGLNFSTMSGDSSVMYSLKSAKSMPLLSEWENRREQCVRHHETLEQQNMQKLQEKQGSVQEARQRIQAINKEKVDKANELNQTWKERNDTATQRRAEQAVKSDDDLVRRFEEHARKRDEEIRRQEEHRSELSQAKTERIKEAQQASRTQQEKAMQKAHEKVQQKEENSQSNIQTKLKEFEERAANQEYADIVRTKYESKISQQLEFQKKAEKEVEAKDKRSKKVLLQKQQSSVEKYRTERNERKAQGSALSRSHGPRLSSQIQPLKDEETLEKEQEATERLMRPSRWSLPALAGGKRGTTRMTAADLGESGRQSLAAVLAGELQVPGEELEGGPRDGHRHSVLSGVDSDDEGVFLKELESRSVKWLHELRSKKEKAAWKP